MEPIDPLNISESSNEPALPAGRSRRQRYIKLIVLVTIALVLLGVIVTWLTVRQASAPAPDSQARASLSATPVTPTPASNDTPTFTTDVLLEGRQNVWDLAFLPDGKLLFTERRGQINLYDDGKVRQVAAISDIQVRGEGGLMGLAIDPRFDSNRQIYACMNSTIGDIRVVRWKLPQSLSGLEERQDIVTGITANPGGRHSGCRLAFGLDGYLWIGTGDSATGPQPQQPKSLNGKVLRVGRDGKGAAGNLGGEFDSRIYNFGHRNIQGIAFFKESKNGVFGLTAEHGSYEDDEVNPLRKGNFGWAPPAGSPIGYEENGVLMTDKMQFPDAIDATWSSGSPTEAPSGLAIIDGSKWQGWDGAIALAILKDRYLKILRLDKDIKVTKEERVLVGEFGRLRAAVQGPDGNLYLSTDNNSNDKIIRLTPQ